MTAEGVISNCPNESVKISVSGLTRLPPPSLTRAYLRRMVCLNLAISLALALIIWAARGHGHHSLAAEVLTSLVHGTAYGSVFGLGLFYLSGPLALLPRPWNSIATMIAIILAAAGATLLIQLILLILGYLDLTGFWREFGYKAAVVSILALLIGWGIHLYENVQAQVHSANLRLKQKELEREQALKLVKEAQLASLESKLHPHFLFNTLNSISTLILEDPILADKIVLRLARLLRSSLDACDQTSVSLDQEIRLAVDYLEIEKVRYGKKLRYSLEMPSEVRAARVPPLILQPLVENSVKFAVFPSSAGGEITITAQQASDRLLLSVRDDGPGFTADAISRGHGLDTLRQRLETLFPEQGSFSISCFNGHTTASISLPNQ